MGNLGNLPLETGQTDAQLAHLEEQQRVWLLWVSRLHDHHERMGTEESRIVLDIAKRRWLAAKAAVEAYTTKADRAAD